MSALVPAGVGGDIATSASTELTATIAEVAPIVVGVLAAIWAVNFALKKLGLRRS